MTNTSNLYVKWGLFVLVAAMLTACSGGSDDSLSTTDTTPPTVTAVYPADSSSDVVVTTPMRVTFSEAMNETTLNGSSCTLTTTSGCVPVRATVSYAAASYLARLPPSSSLAPGHQYTATLPAPGTDAVVHTFAI